jgi:List-Bact-rpt repeat protein
MKPRAKPSERRRSWGRQLQRAHHRSYDDYGNDHSGRVPREECSGTGMGTVTSDIGTNCVVTSAGVSGVCERIYDDATPTLVTLVATPAEGSRFVGWSAACTSDPCTAFADHPPNVPER